jgi:hypothetical protein
VTRAAESPTLRVGTLAEVWDTATATGCRGGASMTSYVAVAVRVARSVTFCPRQQAGSGATEGECEAQHSWVALPIENAAMSHGQV